MKFHETDFRYCPDDKLATLKRYESEGGRWWVDLVAQLFGVRCNIGRGHGALDFGGYDVVYCCGTQKTALLIVPAIVMKILDPVDEAIKSDELRAIFPVQAVKPMYNDRACFSRLCQLAGVEELVDTVCGPEQVELARAAAD